MFQAMTDDQMANLGGLYLLIFFGTPIALFFWINHRFGDRIRHNRRKRQIETQVRLLNYDADILSEVVDDFNNEYGRRNRRR